MHAELDYNLTLDQWETLKALRGSASQRRAPNRFVVEQLVALGLVAVDDGRPLITAKGRSVLLRGSPQLLDLAS
jgi:ribosomal protein S19E (S16A)